MVAGQRLEVGVGRGFPPLSGGKQVRVHQDETKSPTTDLGLPIILAFQSEFVHDPANPFFSPKPDEISQLNWIITAFNLTSAAFLPLWAQAADIFGRYAALQTTIVIILVGSALCTAAPVTSFPVLLLGRALQGVGAAGINICVRTILADRVSLAEYAKNWSIFAVPAAVSFSLGPVAGGYLTKVSWRWCFAINLPVGVVAVGMVVWLLRGELVGAQPLSSGDNDENVRGGTTARADTKGTRFLRRIVTFDYGGQLLFLWGMGLLVLGFTWAGGIYAWESAPVLAPLVVGAVLTIAWVVYEWAMVPGRKMARAFPAQKAMMPWQLLAQRNVGLLLFINFTVGGAMYAVMYFMDLYFTLVKGHNASDAGLALLYFLPGLGGLFLVYFTPFLFSIFDELGALTLRTAGVFMAMFFINVWPRQTMPVLLFGGISSAVGITVLSYACSTDNTPLIYGMMALTGYGVGTNTNPGSLHGLAFFPSMTAAITCIVTFAVPFGGTVALTLISTVFNNRSGLNHADPRTGIVWGFIALIPIMWMGVLITTLLGNVWVLKDGGHEVVHGVWLWSLVRGKTLERVKMTGNQEEANGAVGLPLMDVNSKRPASRDVESGVLLQRG